MPRCGQMSRSAKTWPPRPRPMSSGSPSSVFATVRPGRRSAPGSATYHSPRRSSALRSCMVLSPECRGRRAARAHLDWVESGCVLGSLVGACPLRKTGSHFSGTCATSASAASRCRPACRPPASACIAAQSPSSSRQRRFGLLDDRLERRRLADRKVGEHLAVDQEPGLAETVDEPAIGEAEGAHRRIEALDPQRPEGALAPLAVAIGVLVRLLDRLLGDPDGVLAPAVIALGGFEDLLVLGVPSDTTLDAGHG